MSLRSTPLFRCTAVVAGVCLFSAGWSSGSAQTTAVSPQGSKTNGDELRYVLYVERHGVRSPTGKSAQYNQFSAAPWPEWKVAPGYLTPHGFELIRLFGAYDRLALSDRKLTHAEGCTDTSAVTIYADSDERTRETGKALAAGMFPGCQLAVLGKDEGVNDPLFHPPAQDITPAQADRARAAIAGRIGDNPAALAEAYRVQLAALDHLLATCGKPMPDHKRTSLFDVPVTLAAGSGDHAAELRGPLSTASTITENLLLEYTEDMPATDVGWGCVDAASLRSLIDLHTAASDIAQRTPALATLQSASLLLAIAASLQQAASGQPVAGTPGKPTDHVLFLVGHDTNLSNLAGALNIGWLLDGRRDDTPPGSALTFELWQSPQSKAYTVRTYFTAQTLEQMRSSKELTSQNPPPRVPIFIPGCSRADFSCSLSHFSETIHGLLANKE